MNYHKLTEGQIQESKEPGPGTKGDFRSAMNKEMCTPLNAIIGISHLLLQGELLPSQLENLRALNISAENLLNLVNDLYDFEKIEEGKVVLSEKNIDLRQLAGNIRLANRLRAEERGNKITLLTDPALPACVIGDDTRLIQVLNTLVSNAVKCTTNGAISIQLLVQEIKDQEVTVCFSVIDNGSGIDKEKQALLFDRFTRVNTDITCEFGGQGLGLTLVKRLLALYKSDICFNSEPGKGSDFFFTITFKKGKNQQPKENIQLNGKVDLSGLKVLLVEDVELNVLMAEKMLTNQNAKVEVAENGVIAVYKARHNNYDIVLMDLQMPVMDGYSAAKHIRDFNRDIPIIALTALASATNLQKTREFGMNDYLGKPFKPNELFEMIYKHTRKAVHVL